MFSTGILQLPGWLLLVGVFTYWLIGLVLTGGVIREQAKHPPLSKIAALIPTWILNILFAARASDLLQAGYKKFKNSSYYLVRNSEKIVILPASLLRELANLPIHIASPQAALDHDLLGYYTGINLILEDRLHHSIVQRKLTPNIPLLLPRVEEAVARTLGRSFPASGDWTEIQPFHALSLVAASVSAEALVGPDFSKNPIWLECSLKYTESVFTTAAIMRLLPKWMQKVTYPLLPSYWETRRHLKRTNRLLSSRIQEIMEQDEDGTQQPKGSSIDDANVLYWLSNAVKEKDHHPDVVSPALLVLALASVHTTLSRMVHVLYDVTAAGNSLQEQLITEIETVSQSDWTAASYEKLHLLDSVLRESQRLSPPSTTGMKRVFLESYTFHDGTHIPKGTYTCLPIYAIENDKEHAPQPQEFDGLRSFRVQEQNKRLHRPSNAVAKELLFATPTETSLQFGYGKWACPGRFFASFAIKAVLVKLFSEYEFRFLPNSGRPKNLEFHEFIFPPASQRMLVRRKKGALGPF